jgi:class 3 adenylate cyclase/tetratricopeptide (TPR) repeat protein
MTCPACGTENRPGRSFCGQCGAGLEQVCPSCGTANDPADRFCGACGTRLGGAAAQTGNGPSVAASASTSERRLVSVLFADLVGFTTLSEHRDPEQVRELLSRYFDRCRAIIERYGGTVEKFIGDAVMAVWGTPVAREDDAERAVRASLALTQAVTALGEQVGMSGLRVRAGVLTGPAAVDPAAEGEGMVLGDTVNTASRLQSLAEPGTVLVDDVTRRASEAAIAYEDAGSHEVKGREQAVHTHVALRVVAGVGGQGRAVGLEAPFVGRDHELDLIVEASERSQREQRAELVLVVGEAGAGKSRIGWEFEKHSDGIAEEVRWHRGRCLSYGEGIAYWALAEMVRARAGIQEEEDTGEARAKLRATVETYVPDERERRLVEPRLAHLLGLEQRIAPDRADLFSGWRLFFERMAAADPVILLFEDLHWADSGLLDFLDYLLEWSAEFPIFILALARPEVTEAWPAREPAIRLEALPDAAMHELLSGLVPGLPDEVEGRIRGRAEGIPLYAVETVRMLLDRGLLALDGSRYVVTGDVGDLEVPETLHALVASRLDSLSAAERAVLQDAAVLGQVFTAAGVAAVGDRPQAEAERVLDGLVAKQVLSLDQDPRSPERGQYGFLQALLRTIAYGMLSRRDRKNRHLAAARHLQEAWREDAGEIAELLATHFLDAAEADPEAADAARIRALAAETLAQAGRRAVSLALGREAQRAFDRAASLTEDDGTRAELLEQAGRAAWLEADYETAKERIDAALALYADLGRTADAARATMVVADLLFTVGSVDQAVEVAERGVVGLPEAGADRAAALATLARLRSLTGDYDAALDIADEALTLAEPLEHWETIAGALQTRAVMLLERGRANEGDALLKRSLEVALAHDLPSVALRAYNNLSWDAGTGDRFDEARDALESGLVIARARGDRAWAALLVSGKLTLDVLQGRWDDAVEAGEEILASGSPLPELSEVLSYLAVLRAARGDAAGLVEVAERALPLLDNIDVQARENGIIAAATAALATGRADEALALTLPLVGSAHPSSRRELYVLTGETALSLGDEDVLESVVESVEGRPPGRSTPVMRAEAQRFAGQLAARRGDRDAADRRLTGAAAGLRDTGAPFLLAQVLLERGELLLTEDRAVDALPLVEEARGVFTRLGATPWRERAEAALQPLEQPQ